MVLPTEIQPIMSRARGRRNRLRVLRLKPSPSTIVRAPSHVRPLRIGPGQTRAVMGTRATALWTYVLRY